MIEVVTKFDIKAQTAFSQFRMKRMWILYVAVIVIPAVIGTFSLMFADGDSDLVFLGILMFAMALFVNLGTVVK